MQLIAWLFAAVELLHFPQLNMHIKSCKAAHQQLLMWNVKKGFHYLESLQAAVILRKFQKLL